jgi:hypothetical protein
MGGTQSLARTGPLMMGQSVFIVVGGWGPTPDMAEAGAYTLTLREAPVVPVGMPCTAADTCAAESSCVTPTGMTRGTCTADGALGARCRLMGMACDMGLACSVMMPTATTRGVCQRTLAVGDECGAAGTVCPAMSSCRASPNAMNPARTACVANGARGGACRTDAPRCDMGLECGGTPATCRAQAMMGAECDFTGAMTFCATNTSCAPNAARTSTTCQANGTAAGTACRTDSPRCDTNLECSTAMGAGICQRLVPPGMACDTQYRSTVCTMSSVCAAGMMGAACVAPSSAMEMEPNNTPMAPNGPFTGAVNIRGAIMPATDVDCFRVTVPANGSIRAETSDGMGGCPMGADTLVRLYNPLGTQIAEDDDTGAGHARVIDGRVAAAAGQAGCQRAEGIDREAPVVLEGAAHERGGPGRPSLDDEHGPRLRIHVDRRHEALRRRRRAVRRQGRRADLEPAHTRLGWPPRHVQCHRRLVAPGMAQASDRRAVVAQFDHGRPPAGGHPR